MNNWFLAASIATAATAWFHVMFMGRYVVRPLLKARSLAQPSRMTSYLAWHLVTLWLLVTSAGFVLSALEDASTSSALLSTVSAAGAGGICLSVISHWKLRPAQYPQFLLFFPIALLGLVGLLAG
jgi:hypothetical protein